MALCYCLACKLIGCFQKLFERSGANTTFVNFKKDVPSVSEAPMSTFDDRRMSCMVIWTLKLMGKKKNLLGISATLDCLQLKTRKR